MGLSVAHVGGTAAASEPALKQATSAVFEPGACPRMSEPVPALEKARCGFLVVPESRAKPNGRAIRLPVAIIAALSDPPADDPVVYMEGGPGGPALPSAQLLVNAGLNRQRDIIIMGQRGTRYAEPALVCPEIDRFDAKRVGLPFGAASTGQQFVDASRACYQRFLAAGIDLGAYNTTESAADFADLRIALGIAEWNVYGVSYGTDLALTYMREHPQGIRSVTLNSVVPPQLANLGMGWINAGVGLDNLFRACAAELGCHERYPDPGAVLARLVRQFESDPLTATVVPVLVPGKKPEPDAQPVKVVLDGGAFANWVITMTEALGTTLPALLDEIARGRTHDVMASVAAAASAQEGVMGWGLFNGVVCSEWVPYEGPDDIINQGRRAFPTFPTSVLAHAPQFPFMIDICRAWQVPKAPAAQREATRSAIPTLLIAGSFDAVTSSQSAAAAARSLTNSTLVIVPGAGHVVMPKSSCVRRVMASFLAKPNAPDTACVSALTPAPEFVVAPP